MVCRIIKEKKNYFFVFLLLACLSGFKLKAQISDPSQKPDSLDTFVGINLHQDPKIFWVLDRRREYNKKIINSGIGYRLLLYSGPKRQEALTLQTYFKQLYPNLETYISFSFPNFKLFGGDFRNRDDGNKVLDHIHALLNINPILNPQKIDPTKVYTGN